MYEQLTTKTKNTMEMICKEECTNMEGVKTMDFTKGKTYDVQQIDDDLWMVNSDSGITEEFFRIDIMFELVK